MSRSLKITIGTTSRGSHTKPKTVEWNSLVKRLGKFQTLPIQMAKYLTLTVDQKGDLKDKTGFFIGGWFSDNTRKKAALLGRSLLTLDVDSLPAYELDGVAAVYEKYAYVMHSSMSHRAEKPKFRLVFPFTRDITVEEYEPIARMVASWLSIDGVDKVSYRPTQLMYNPAVCEDGETLYSVNEGEWLNPDKVLAHYSNWHDFDLWPKSASEKELRQSAAQMEDPCKKGGVIGAFCVAFDIHQAIQKFELPYTPTELENRYTPVGSSGSQGAVIYPSDSCEAAFLYSHHSQDVAANRCLNAWDLVRHCKWPKDKDAESHKKMMALALSLDEVNRQLDSRLVDSFDDLGDEPDAEEASKTQKKKKVKGDRVYKENVNYPRLSQELEDKENAQPHTDVAELRTWTKNYLEKLAGARLDPSDEDVLTARIRLMYIKKEDRPSKARLHGDIMRMRKTMAGSTEAEDGTMTDIEIEIINECFHRYYGDGEHIRRVGRSFWIYDGGCWRVTEDEQVRGRLIETITDLRTKRPEDVIQLVAAIGENETSAIAGRLFSLMPSIVARKYTDKDPLGLRSDRLPIVNCLNGELHLNDDGKFELREHDPKHFLTAQIPVNYDPEAVCPEWNTFCEYIFGDAIDPNSMQKHLEELGGYVIQPTRFLRTWVLFHGPTAAGKTTIGKVFGNLLGGSAVMRPVSSYDGRNTHAEAGLVGRLMLLDEDFDKGAVLPDGFLKKISEAKELTANPKNKDEYSFVCRALPIIISNSWPATRDVSDALIDRALVWDLTQQIMGKQRNDATADIMTKDELPGILNKFLAGFERLRKRGAWSPPVENLLARDMWVSKSNAVGRFLMDCVEKAQGSVRVKTSELWDTYRAWMNDAMPGARKVGRNEFYERCDHVLGIRSKIGGEWYYNGARVKSDSLLDF